MSMQNTVSGEQLKGFVERLERIRGEKKALSDDAKVIMAEAAASGFIPKFILHCVKIREQKPSEVQEARALADMYLSALGLAPEPPLFRAMNLISVDIASKESVVEALKKFVPAEGSITVEAGGKPIKISRNKDGVVSVAEVSPPRAAPETKSDHSPHAKQKPPVPDVDAEGAEELGRQAARDDMAIISNPFPFGDARRARFDLGWRKEAGTDGMGPDD